jgi:hypothetical protein
MIDILEVIRLIVRRNRTRRAKMQKKWEFQIPIDITQKSVHQKFRTSKWTLQRDPWRADGRSSCGLVAMSGMVLKIIYPRYINVVLHGELESRSLREQLHDEYMLSGPGGRDWSGSLRIALYCSESSASTHDFLLSLFCNVSLSLSLSTLIFVLIFALIRRERTFFHFNTLLVSLLFSSISLRL